ncbi:hypothetical protein M3Y94_01266700 [Aphelenchoides besseyi]|nr:hypothetical protein M3Y94_01266700 [Aphelenchoides besseyi]KAI6222594.1 hypothetical protein M3Y95_00910200 [Aphelenchoides besseyi]
MIQTTCFFVLSICVFALQTFARRLEASESTANISKCVSTGPVTLYGRCADSAATIRIPSIDVFSFNLAAPNATFDRQNTRINITLIIGGCEFDVNFHLEPTTEYEYLPFDENHFELWVFFQRANSNVHPGGRLPLRMNVRDGRLYLRGMEIERNCRIGSKQNDSTINVEMKLNKNGQPTTHPTFQISFDDDVRLVGS